MSRTAVSMLTLALVAAAGCATEAPNDMRIATRLQAIQGGEIDNDLTNVVGIGIQMGGGMAICSGALIAPNLVLTAQHCVAETPAETIQCGRSRFGDPYGANLFSVTTWTQLFTRGATFYGVREVHVAEQNADLCGQDVALLVLDSNVSPNTAVPLKPRIDRRVVAGERFTAAGFGEIGDGSGSGTRRSVGGKQVLCGENACRAGGQVTGTEWIGSDGACQGDSGGPALDGAGYVIGVLSRGGPGCQQPVYSGVQSRSEWLQEMGRHAAEVGGYEPDGWVTDGDLGPPPPDTDGDGARDPYDNCLDVPNPGQSDLDSDGVGDLCDANDDRDRGGVCDICDGCVDDAGCGEGEFCAQTSAAGGVCTKRCTTGDECPDSTVCFEMQRGSGICLNADLQRVGPCPESFLCGGARPTPPDDGQCHVCEPCETDEACNNGGVCADLGAGKVCTRLCEATMCRGDSVCAAINGQSLCVNPEADARGICAETYVCGQGYVEPEPEPEPEPAPEPQPDPQPDPDDGVVPPLDPAALDQDIERVGKKKNTGCTVAPGTGGEGAAFLLLPILALGLTRRRRRA